jgi:hypothetical protein
MVVPAALPARPVRAATSCGTVLRRECRKDSCSNSIEADGGTDLQRPKEPAGILVVCSETEGTANGSGILQNRRDRGEWRVRHDGSVENVYQTKESAFEAAVAAASLALRQGHEVEITAPGSETATGAANPG